jgi:hypothetical protein
MKLTEEQINQIIEGLENPKTKLVAINKESGKAMNEIQKQKSGDYKNKFFIGEKLIDTSKSFKEHLIRILETETRNFSFELITTNEDLTETRTKI